MKKKKKKIIQLPEFEIHSESFYENLNPIDFTNIIIENYYKVVRYLKIAKKNSDIEQLYIGYGQYSHSMNKVLRKLIKNETDEDKLIQYKLAYAIWWNRTHYIETFKKGFFGQINDRKSIDNGFKSLLNFLNSKSTAEDIKKVSEKFYDLIERLSNLEYNGLDKFGKDLNTTMENLKNDYEGESNE